MMIKHNIKEMYDMDGYEVDDKSSGIYDEIPDEFFMKYCWPDGEYDEMPDDLRSQEGKEYDEFQKHMDSMNENKIKINEKQLRRIIKESVKRILTGFYL